MMWNRLSLFTWRVVLVTFKLPSFPFFVPLGLFCSKPRKFTLEKLRKKNGIHWKDMGAQRNK